MTLNRLITVYLFIGILALPIMAAVPTPPDFRNEIPSSKVPYFKRKSTKEITKHITTELREDEEKVWAIFLWITENIEYDTKRFVKQSPKRYSTKKILKRKKALCDEYARLFVEMCTYAGIEAMTVTGYSKGATSLPDDLYYTPNHMWNLVRINGKWELVDVTYAVGYITQAPSLADRIRKILTSKPLYKSKTVFKKDRNDQYYLSKPKIFVKDHLPADPMFQLLNNPVSVEVFEGDEELIAKFLDSSIGEMPYESWINTFKEEDWDVRVLWEADSALAFNCRNYLQQCLALYNVGIIKLEETEKQGRYYDPDQLRIATRFFDSSKVINDFAKDMVKEEKGFDKEKNKIRRELAKTGIKHSQKVQNKLHSYLKGLPKKDWAKLDQVDLQIDQANELLYLIKQKSLNNVKEKKTDDQSQVNQNKKIIKKNLDELKLLSKELRSIYDSIDNTLFLTLTKINDSITTAFKMSYAYTHANIEMRIMNMDNIHKEVDLNCKRRDEHGEEILALLERKKVIDERLKAYDRDYKDKFKLWKNLVKENSRLLKQNKKLGDTKAEDEFYEIYEQMTSELEQVIAKNLLLEDYINLELAWCKMLYKYTGKYEKLLIAEQEAEDKRFEKRKEKIEEEKEMLTAQLQDIKKKSTENIKTIKDLKKKKRR